MRLGRRAQDNVVAVVLLLVLVGFAAVSLTYGERARLVPFPMAIASILLILLQLYLQNARGDAEAALHVDALQIFARKGGEVVGRLPEGEGADDETLDVVEEPGGSERMGVLLVALFVGLILLVGVLPAVFLYVFGHCLFVGKRRLLPALAAAGCTELVIYLLFVSILKVPMYAGWLPSLFG